MFNFYPKINYKVNDYDLIRGIDISYTAKIKDYLKTYRGIKYYPYIVKDGERPDTVSMKFYKTPNYDWLILLMNDMYSVYDDWPKDSATFDRFIIEKYGSISNANSNVKYYLDAKGNIIDLTTYNSLASSQRSIQSDYDYEFNQNFIKSRIKVADSLIVNRIQSELSNLTIAPLV